MEIAVWIVINFVIYFVWIFLVSMLWWNTNIKSVAQVAGIFLVLSILIGILGIHTILAFGIMAFASIFLFTYFFDFEPMQALLAWFLFSAFNGVVLIIISTFLW